MQTPRFHTLWPDEKESYQLGYRHGGRRRGIGYDKILKLYRNARVEDIIALYRSTNSARVALHNLRKKLYMMPAGLWKFTTEEIMGTQIGLDRQVYTAIVGCFFGKIGDTEDRKLLNPVMNRLTIEELDEVRRLQLAVKNIPWTPLADRLLRGDYSNPDLEVVDGKKV